MTDSRRAITYYRPDGSECTRQEYARALERKVDEFRLVTLQLTGVDREWLRIARISCQ